MKSHPETGSGTATLIFLAQDIFRRDASSQSEAKMDETPTHVWGAILFQFAVAIYGGHFGAGIGNLMLATLGFIGMRNIYEMNTLKTILGSLINLMAALWFISNPTGADITVTDYVGNQQKGTTPLKLTLKSGKGFFSASYYDIEAKMDGYSTAKVRLTANLNGYFFGNFALGGPYGMLLGGLWIDPATGAMWKLPPQYTVNLSKTTADNSEHTNQMLSIDSTPKELPSKIVAIK